MQAEASTSGVVYDYRSLLGRLRLKLMNAIAGDSQRSPSDREIQQYLFNHHRENPTAGDVLFALLAIRHPKSCEFSLLPSVDLESLLDDLEDNPWPDSRFLEITGCPSPFPTSLGVLVDSWPRATGGHAYIITLFSEKAFPGAYAGRAEITAYRGQRLPFAGVLVGPGKFDAYNANENAWSNEHVLSIGLAAIRFLHSATTPRYLALSEAKRRFAKSPPRSLFSPPQDAQYEQLLAEVNAGRIPCYRTQLPMELIVPYSFAFCMLYPLEIVRLTLGSIRVGKLPAIHVYAKQGWYIMSEDYPTYLSYWALGIRRIPVVIVGDFPDRDIYPYEVGGKELVADVGVIQLPDYSGMNGDVRRALLDQRIKRELLVENYVDTLRSFHDLLARSDISERELHNFLHRHPLILDPGGIRLMSEVTLGPYRADLIIEVDGDARSLTLVELERSTLSIFTKSGRLRAPVVHAIQQVEDWLQWWRENPELVPPGFDAKIPPDGLVVIGRSIALNEADKRRIRHLNHNRKVRLCTYDDLAVRFEQLVLNLESSSPGGRQYTI